MPRPVCSEHPHGRVRRDGYDGRHKEFIRWECVPGDFVSVLFWEGRSLTFVAEQAGHSVATLARHYAEVRDELEDQPRTLAAETINAAGKELKCAQFVRSAGTDERTPPAESRATTGVGDTGLEPVTSALSRRICVVKL